MNNHSDAQHEFTQVEKLIKITENATFFRSQHMVIYATLPINDHIETWSIRSHEFKLWLIKKFYDIHHKPITNQAITDALNVIESKFIFNKSETLVFQRIGMYEDNIFIDLVNEKWEVVQINKNGWKVITNPPIRFLRHEGMRSLPHPNKRGDLNLLKKYINYKDEDGWKLIVSWILSTLNPDGPFPILVLNGEQGSAKSTTSKVLKALIDPTKALLRQLPKDERELMIMSHNNWILPFDNLSDLNNNMSDNLCRLSTGGGFSKRKLFTDLEEVIIDIKRPIILNGIEDIVTRADLLERSLVITLPPLQNERIDELSFWQNFEKDKSFIFGAILNVITEILNERQFTKIENPPRMLDFALWVKSAEKFLKWENDSFLAAYEKNQIEVIVDEIENDSLGNAIVSLMSTKEKWDGTATDLVNELNYFTNDQSYFQRNVHGRNIKNKLVRISSSLRKLGISMNFYRINKGRIISLFRNDKF